VRVEDCRGLKEKNLLFLWQSIVAIPGREAKLTRDCKQLSYCPFDCPIVVSISRFDTSRFDTHLSRFVTNMKSIRYSPSRFDTNSCVCIKLKQKPQIQNQRFHSTVTVAHIKTTCSHQIQITHIKFKSLTANYKSLTANSNCSQQITNPPQQITNRSHQIQIVHSKYKSLTANTNTVRVGNLNRISLLC